MAAEFREVIERRQFQQEKGKLKHSEKRLDEMLDGIIWTLARLPESYPQIPGTDLYLAKSDAVPGVAGLYIWFRYNENQVFLESIEAAPIAE
jgi:hypothetical protein